ncbi:hypothetical protein KM043_013034 [Ampulex compressa]|nr:hypothetical protein KM043_013034 [Ampulex compressa]
MDKAGATTKELMNCPVTSFHSHLAINGVKIARATPGEWYIAQAPASVQYPSAPSRSRTKLATCGPKRGSRAPEGNHQYLTRGVAEQWTMSYYLLPSR